MTAAVQIPRGASAASICAQLCGLGDQMGDYPMDAADFGRCEAFLDANPDLRPRLPEMATVNAYWAALAPAWDAIRSAPRDLKTTMIRGLTRPIEARDPSAARMGIAVLRPGTAITFKDGQAPGATSSPEPSGKQSRMKTDPDFKRHNQKAFDVSADELRQFIERYEELAAEKSAVADQQKEVMAGAKARGYDTKAIRAIIALRKKTPDERAEAQAVLDVYLHALGMA